MNGLKAGLDPRSWLIWAVAASVPVLVGRNPFPIVVVLLAATLVYTSLPRNPASHSLNWVLRIAVVFAVISVLFNALTVHSGDRILFTIPDSVPIAGGIVTLNAVVFGLLSASAILALILVGVTLAAGLDWASFVRLLPDSLMTIGMAGSVAFVFFPQMVESFREIREARQIRGMPASSLNDYVQMAPAILSSGLEKATTTAELLESRGFGATLTVDSRTRGQATAIVGFLVSVCVTAYLIAVDQLGWSLAALAITLGLVAFLFSGSRSRQSRRTRYRELVLHREDWIVIGASILALVTTIVMLVIQPAALRYEPYPTLTVPFVSLPLLAALVLLAAPAIVYDRTRTDAHHA